MDSVKRENRKQVINLFMMYLVGGKTETTYLIKSDDGRKTQYEFLIGKKDKVIVSRSCSSFSRYNIAFQSLVSS